MFLTIELLDLIEHNHETVEETSLQNLEKKAIKAFPLTRKRHHAIDPIHIIGQKWVALPKNKKLRIEASVRGSTEGKSKTYTAIINRCSTVRTNITTRNSGS